MLNAVQSVPTGKSRLLSGKKIFSIILFSVLLTQLSFAQWSEQTSPVTTTLYSVSAVDNNVVWACGASGRVLLTTNGGTSWTSVVTPNATLPLYNIWAVDASTALVTGSTANTFVYKTTNGGSSWTQVFTQTGGFIDAIFGVSGGLPNLIAMIGDPVGGRWSIWYSSNTGSTWDSTTQYLPQAGGETGWNNSAAAIPLSGNNTAIWFGTSNTRVYYTINAQTFTSQTTTGLVNSFAVWFNDSARGMVGGTSMLTTVNSGTLWTSITAPGTGSINGIVGAGNNWWYVRSTSVYYSLNNGVSWSTDYTAPAGNFQHISKSRTGNSMWAVRANGGIARSLGPIGIEPISSQIPVKYSLYQNYPNPFNPATTIKFDIPISSYVKLIVYDAIGREVATLVNENLKAGIYELHWDASAYTSGIYFYTIKTEAFAETRKMILVK